jgi:hypothetical protein
VKVYFKAGGNTTTKQQKTPCKLKKAMGTVLLETNRTKA